MDDCNGSRTDSEYGYPIYRAESGETTNPMGEQTDFSPQPRTSASHQSADSHGDGGVQGSPFNLDEHEGSKGHPTECRPCGMILRKNGTGTCSKGQLCGYCHHRAGHEGLFRPNRNGSDKRKARRKDHHGVDVATWTGQTAHAATAAVESNEADKQPSRIRLTQDEEGQQTLDGIQQDITLVRKERESRNNIPKHYISCALVALVCVFVYFSLSVVCPQWLPDQLRLAISVDVARPMTTWHEADDKTLESTASDALSGNHSPKMEALAHRQGKPSTEVKILQDVDDDADGDGKGQGEQALSEYSVGSACCGFSVKETCSSICSMLCGRTFHDSEIPFDCVDNALAAVDQRISKLRGTRVGKRSGDEVINQMQPVIELVLLHRQRLRPAQLEKVALLYKYVAEYHHSHDYGDEALRLFNMSAEMCSSGSSLRLKMCLGQGYLYQGHIYQNFFQSPAYAKDWYTKARDVYFSAYEGHGDHPELQPVLKELDEAMSLLHLALGDYQTAKRLAEKVLNFRSTTYARHDPELADAYLNLGLIYDQLEDHDLAAEHFEKCERIRRCADSNAAHADTCPAGEPSYYTSALHLWRSRNSLFRGMVKDARDGFERIVNASVSKGTLLAAQSAMCLGDFDRLAGAGMAHPEEWYHKADAWYDKAEQHCRERCSTELQDSIKARRANLGRKDMKKTQVCRWEASWVPRGRYRPLFSGGPLI